MSALVTGTPVSNAGSIRSSEWPLDAEHFKADRIWSISRGAGTTVAVVDSGVSASHPDLAGQVLPGASLIGDGDDGRTDTSGESHGTAIAGIIAGTGGPAPGEGMTGLAPDAKILPVRVGTGNQVSAPMVARGIVWAADHGARIINVSLGAPEPDPLLKQAVTYAMGKDAVVVASAGNEGDRGNPPMYPAAFPGVVSVSGVDETGTFWKASESGRGIVVAAPAAEIYSTNNQGRYVKADGTSYAAAYVSATAALIRSAHPDLTAGQVIHRLITTTVERNNHPDPKLGFGRIDPISAISSTDDGERENPLLRESRESVDAGSDSDSGLFVIIVSSAGIVLVACAAAVFRRRSRGRGNIRESGPSRPVVNAAGKSARPRPGSGTSSRTSRSKRNS
ncbi:type VII secretion-associated serine protease mycosin [Kitasatospora cathayae]|uniref:Type VII secretion-associated serine protease mycosin n=1 Tax=Kitasatospora cathayae TaxID=3004092 RepID=A0ABY7QEB3_9ACTN|nr:type VII secretion-associated serine protease mycosin [Kitasatospora sp. HUAS 3-15]WBP91109.1 type VII secretion-associated serine protease mycosin [Kitasatospora sp. HUAS 3-15]